MDDELGLPSLDELTPLSQTLISPQLASAFSITKELSNSQGDFLSLFSLTHQSSSSYFNSFLSLAGKDQDKSGTCVFEGEERGHARGMAMEAQAVGGDLAHRGMSFGPFASNPAGSNPGRVMQQGGMELSRKAESVVLPSQFGAYERRVENPYGLGIGACDSSNGGGGQPKRARTQTDGSESEDRDGDGDGEGDSGGAAAENSAEDQAARTLKRPRLVWTPQLHKRFVDAVAHLGIKNAVPKTIMQLMNVEGLTRENVASHLQKYRLYLKRMQGLTSEGGSSISDQLFASTPIPPALAGSPSPNFQPGHREDALAIPFAPPIAPLAIPALSPLHMEAALAYGGLDQHGYAAIMRANAHRFTAGEQREFRLENQAPSNSSQRPILTLFPTGGQ